VVAALVAAGLGLGGCVRNPVGPVASAPAYTEKARRTVADVRSAAKTARLAVAAEVTGGSFRAYTGHVVDDALAAVDTAEGTFETIVPPDDASGELRGRVLDAVTAARRGISDLVTAVDRDDAALDAVAHRLDPVIDQLDGLDGELG
jgi:hypothetical protein